ncbi:hypothetical protein WIS52_12905 [Pseudonocardia nematodicida]|uniref:Uncharacterized protein n=1 Tax=Pseudonocardia nematodicida TaxID=1206997 RepID=A0ABV1KA61_9PSEU
MRIALAAACGPVRMPDDVAARIRARLALAGTATPTGPPSPAMPATGSDRDGTVRGPGAARRRTSGGPHGTRRDRTSTTGPGRAAPERRGAATPGRQRLRSTLRAGVALASLAAAVALIALPLLLRPPADPVRAAATDALRAAAVGVGSPAGALDPARVRACLVATGVVDPDAPLLAARPHRFDDEPAILLVLGTPERGRHRIVVVPTRCDRGDGRVLADTTVP